MVNDFADDRFSSVLSDPKFRKPRKRETKVKIDKRFQSMFTNKAFKVKYKVDKRGRPVSKSSTEDFKKFYDLPSDEDVNENASSGASESDSEEDQVTSKVKDDKNFPQVNEDEREATQINESIREKLKDLSVDYARGEGRLFSESSSDESESEDSDLEDLYHEWNELDKDAGLTENITKRLAVCNMDWDRIRALDLLMLFNSFLPTGAFTESVIIYPSEFGLKRMQEEELKGPAELVQEQENTSDVDEDEDSEGKDFHTERMRQYQLNRLKYYYAIASFDDAKTADFIYNSCNGLEYESSGIRLDLRFVDDDTTFDQEPKDKCYSCDDVSNYLPRYFKNSALQQAKVELTWDETDPKRAEFTQKIIEAAKSGDINDSDLKNFVALSSSDEENEEEEEGNKVETFESVVSDENDESNEETDPILSFRKLMKEIEETHQANNQSEEEEELEITWGSGNSKTKSIIKKSDAEGNKHHDLTPFERLVEKKKEKSKLRKVKLKKETDAENKEAGGKGKRKTKGSSKGATEDDEAQRGALELLLAEDKDDSKHHFNLKKIIKTESKSKKKKLNRKDKLKAAETDDFQVDVNDERFKAIYTSHLFNIDPTNPKFYKTKGMEAFVSEKQKRIVNDDVSQKNVDEPQLKKKKTESDSELSFLVKSVKNKTKTMLPRKFNKKNKN